MRAFKGIICADVSEFESYHASHAVGSLWPEFGWIFKSKGVLAMD